MIIGEEANLEPNRAIDNLQYYNDQAINWAMQNRRQLSRPLDHQDKSHGSRATEQDRSVVRADVCRSDAPKTSRMRDMKALLLHW
jgi:hypothetical protein